MFVIDLPTHLVMGIKKPKQIPLNLNFYRNADFNQLNNMKIQFDKIVSPSLKAIPFMENINITYRLFMPSKRMVDISNVCCIVDKFFSDTLKNAQKIPDDNMEVISSIKYLWGGVDKNNPRVEATLQIQENPMQITSIVKLEESDIVAAIERHVREEMSIREEIGIQIKLNYDSPDGFTAQATIGNSAVVLPAEKAQVRRGRPPKIREVTSEAKPVAQEEPLRVEEDPEPETVAEEEVDPVKEAFEPQTEEAQEAPQEAAVAPIMPIKGLFASKATSSPTPAPAAAPAPTTAPKQVAMAGNPSLNGTAPPSNVKSLFNLRGMTAPKNEEVK